MPKDYSNPPPPRKPRVTFPDAPRVVCLDCHRARLEGRPWGCRVHVAEEVLP